MTHHLDVARGRDIVARWCALAEGRLEHLTELFETGRWRRYHSELAFLENIQEAKSAVQIWRNLLMHEASPDNSAIDISWLGRSRTAPLHERLHDLVRRPQPHPTAIADQPPAPDVRVAAPTAHVWSDDAPAIAEVPEPMRDLKTIEQRYPLLRNAL